MEGKFPYSAILPPIKMFSVVALFRFNKERKARNH